MTPPVDTKGAETSKMYLPKQVIKHLIRYIDDGCELEVVEEELNGETINRWIANGILVLWSERQTNE